MGGSVQHAGPVIQQTLACGLLISSLVAAGRLLGAQPDLVIADFEGTNYGDWQATGTAFGPGPARGTLPNQMPVDGFLGRGLVNSYYGGDGATGTLTSPPFRIQRRYLRFLIGGGGHAGLTCLNLRVDGQVVRTATGPNTRPGGSERLSWEQWDVAPYLGREAVLEIVDRATGGWGHINVDHIIQTDRPLPGVLTNVSRVVVADRRYLNLPVKNGAPKRWVSLRAEGHVLDEFEIELADQQPDWWAFVDLSAARGQPVTVEVDRLPEDSTALRRMQVSDRIVGDATLYQEPLRPQFHFTTRRGWINDPNGLVFYQGEYHLFYQHNPYGWNWGNMHWGHAVSPDLVHWEELGEALYPDALGTIWSGSAVVDWRDTAGFGRGGPPALVCIYTAAGGTSRQSQGARFTQCIAWSTNRGRSFVKYAANPVLSHLVGENRDPKVFWYAPQNKWLMALYLEGNEFGLFESPDLKRWTRLSSVRLPGSSECPELFELPVQGQPGTTRWIFYGGNGRYLIGRFDGRSFLPESGPLPLHQGNCFYASQTFNDIPPTDGRRILMAWGQVNFPGMPFNQMMTFPVELALRPTEQGLRLFVNPVREIQRLHVRCHQWTNLTVAPGQNPLAGLQGELWDMQLRLQPGQADQVRLRVRGEPVVYDARRQVIACGDRQAPLPLKDGTVELRLLVDRGLIELFGNAGALYMPMRFVPKPQNRALELSGVGGPARVESLAVWELRSAWPQASATRRRP